MTTFNNYWLEQHRTLLGLSHQINLFSTWLAFFDADDPCYLITLSMAGFPFYFDPSSFNDPTNPDCVDYHTAFPRFFTEGQKMPGLSPDVEFYT